MTLMLIFGGGLVLAADGPIDQTGKILNEAATAGDYNTNNTTNFVTTIAAVIQGVLSFVGIIFFLYIIYAGFLWVTAHGDEDRITKAKSILKNNIIGVVVVLAAGVIVNYAITVALARVLSR